MRSRSMPVMSKRDVGGMMSGEQENGGGEPTKFAPLHITMEIWHWEGRPCGNAAKRPYPAAGGGVAVPSPSRPSRIFLRTSWAADLISCIFFRTRVPAALLPPAALFTSSSASCTKRLSVSYSCTETSFKGPVKVIVKPKTLLAAADSVNLEKC